MRASEGGRNYMLGPQMKIGACGEPPSSERWPCLLSFLTSRNGLAKCVLVFIPGEKVEVRL